MAQFVRGNDNNHNYLIAQARLCKRHSSINNSGVVYGTVATLQRCMNACYYSYAIHAFTVNKNITPLYLFLRQFGAKRRTCGTQQIQIPGGT
jgi:hypothetical protein